MSGNFEVLPCGTLQRLAQVEAERDSMREILDHIPQVEAELEETSDRLHAVEAERDALLAALERLLPAYRKAVKLYDPNTDDDLTVAAHNAIAKAKGGGNG